MPGVKNISLPESGGRPTAGDGDGANSLSDGVQSYHVLTGEEDVRAELSRQIVQGGFSLLEMRLTGNSLEDLFIRIVADDTKEGENER